MFYSQWEGELLEEGYKRTCFILERKKRVRRAFPGITGVEENIGECYLLFGKNWWFRVSKGLFTEYSGGGRG